MENENKVEVQEEVVAEVIPETAPVEEAVATPIEEIPAE